MCGVKIIDPRPKALSAQQITLATWSQTCKKVGDSIFITEIDEGVSIIGRPDVAKNPMTGELERIIHVVEPDKKTYCPKCKNENEPGIEITVTETELCIYPCKRCNQFVWFRSKNK